MRIKPMSLVMTAALAAMVLTPSLVTGATEILTIRGLEVLGAFPPDVQGYAVMVAGVSSRTPRTKGIERKSTCYPCEQ